MVKMESIACYEVLFIETCPLRRICFGLTLPQNSPIFFLFVDFATEIGEYQFRTILLEACRFLLD